MDRTVTFGWRVPDFPVDGSPFRQFRDQIYRNLDVLQGDFASAWVVDHFFPWMGGVEQTRGTTEAWTTIAYLAGRYPHIDLGSIVLCQAYRSPALLAKMAATLQELSGGRFILGLGAGWKHNEFSAYGYDYPSTAVRIDQLEEAVQVIRAMWTDPAPVFHGNHYSIENAYCEPRPDPLPPIMIGGGGRKRTLRIVAQYADWWNFPSATPEHYAELLAVLREHCQAVGRNYDAIVKTWTTDCVSVAATHEEAVRQAQASPYFANVPDAALVGTPDEVAMQMQKYIDLGVSHLMFRFVDFPSTSGAELFVKEVMPRFR
jgi:F420-dependent oxidoreductase-like protein